MKIQRTKIKRHLYHLSTAGFVLGAILAMLPLGMSAYARWEENRSRGEFEKLLHASERDAGAAPLSLSTATHRVDPSTFALPNSGEIDSDENSASIDSLIPHQISPDTADSADLSLSVLPQEDDLSLKPEPIHSSFKEATPPEPIALPPSKPTAPETVLMNETGTQKQSRKPGVTAKPKKKPKARWELAHLEIPAIGVDAIVKERKGSWRWTTGVAHEPGTARPGEPGNCIMAAHRNMWDAAFAQLPKLKPGHEVILRTRDGIHTYIVESSSTVQTKDKSPLYATSHSQITLYTCIMPFNAQQRWVVQGRLTDTRQAKNPGL